MTVRRKLLIFFSLAMLIAISVTNVTYAGDDHHVADALREYMVSVTESDFDVSVEGELAIFTTRSEGTGWTTWKDVAFLKRAYDSVRQESVKEEINSIQVIIIDSQGEIIYDCSDFYINYPPNGEYVLRDESPENDIPEEAVLIEDNAVEAAEEAPVLYEDNAVADAKGEPVEFSDTVVLDNEATGKEIEDALDNVKNEMMLREADDTCNLSQSEVTIKNEDGEVVAYYAADHENGAYFSWSAKP